jgi:predicted Zn-dependent protease
MDNTTEVVKETQKEVVNTIQNNTNEYLEHSLKLMKKLEENDTIRAYKNKMVKQNKTLADALNEIQKLREQALEDLMRDASRSSNPMDFISKMTTHGKKFGEQVVEEGKIMTKALTQE